ncbi:hypothetical protein EGT29_12965 [Pigmentiphaga sp. H8]|uniref:M30 family zinc metallopeptidase n=1 Tax=Pigmentiphaga sp. H8 TaxID=2488560 RepID=UPI000F594E1D|nr:hypothetical protein [Pigmentiphaga sp. H8]AZG08701.1 hypothetical protein EGT29_12965 [Pigmentiphaga sp. H8]
MLSFSLRMRTLPLRLALLGPALVLSACGGDGAVTPDTPEPPPPAVARLAVDCSGPHCGAVDAHRYLGSGVGIWQYTNTTGERREVEIDISGLAGKDVQLIMTNHDDAPLKMPGIELFERSPYPADVPAAARRAPAFSLAMPVASKQAAENLATEKQATASRAVAPASVVGATRLWWVDTWTEGRVERPFTLHRQDQAQGPDGSRRVNIWLEDDQYGDGLVDDAMLDTLLQRVTAGPRSVYTRATELAGEPWGQHETAGAIPPAQDLNIVLGKELAYVSYPGSRDLRIRQQTGNPDFDEYVRTSNEALAVYLTTERFYQPDDYYDSGEPPAAMALLLTQLANIYHRSALPANDQSFEPWLDMMTALMMQDILYLPGSDAYQPVGDIYRWYWLSMGATGGFNCGLKTARDAADNSCYVLGAQATFGAYLLRQYGIGFYRQLLRNTSSADSWAILDDAIKQAGGEGADAALRRFATNIALLPAAASPKGYGLPERTDGAYTLAAIDGATYASELALPTDTIMTLMPRAFFPFARPAVRDTYRENIVVPPHASLSVVVR